MNIEPVTVSGPAVTRPVMLQGWYDLTSIHWRYEPEVVQRLLPKGFTVDVFDGSAWVGLIPFNMRRIRLPNGWSAGRWSSFPETNIRTYIVGPDGRRAVWFCSLDITRLAPTLVARVSYGLPYCWASMTIEHPSPDVVTYSSKRRWPRGVGASNAGGASKVSVRVGELLGADAPDRELCDFLSARWALGSTFLGKLLWAQVDHPPWELHRAEILELDECLLRAAGLPDPVGDPIALWSPGVEVRIGWPHLVR